VSGYTQCIPTGLEPHFGYGRFSLVGSLRPSQESALSQTLWRLCHRLRGAFKRIASLSRPLYWVTLLGIGWLPGLPTVHAQPATFESVPQKYSHVPAGIFIRLAGLAACRCGTQRGNSNQLHCLASPLLGNLPPMFSMIVRAKECAVAIERQLRSPHDNLIHSSEVTG
jgi:hypothetical protein